MYFHKYPAAVNFEFTGKSGLVSGGAKLRLHVEEFEDDIYHVAVTGGKWPAYRSLTDWNLPPKRSPGRRGCRTGLETGRDLSLRLTDRRGRALLSSIPGKAFGVSGAASLFLFDRRPSDAFYGMGEKGLGLELSNVRAKFWNTDVWGDFHWLEIIEDRVDPMYVSIPYLIVKRGATFTGLLLDNPYPAFLSTAEDADGFGPLGAPIRSRPCITLGAEGGPPRLYIIHGPTLRELTRKFQKLVGVTPLPPAWALGYHQCRWGYRSLKDLNELDRRFREHRVPCDALWLDIDYMNGYRVFTFNPKHFPSPRKDLARIARKGRRVVCILDPGVKRERGYAVYESGRKAGAFCRNPEGGEFVGSVWPGETVFPDFSTDAGRNWWRDRVREFAALGVQGAWLDMNEPSTGRVDDAAMLFDQGRLPQAAFHNQYALGMARASREGLLLARPNRRPFQLCRAGCTGIGRFTAIWTGDNCSSYHHLRMCIPTSINLALSGVPFNGADVGGFSGDTNGRLLADWQKLAFLFPFCRNHAHHESTRQEPWRFGKGTLSVVRHYIQLRYKLRPYLYNLFVAQEETGEAILRPLFYDFTDTRALPLGKVDDQFLAGPSIMQAPMLHSETDRRAVVLPGKRMWYSAMDAGWVRGGRKIQAAPGPMQTPLYVREGAILPMSRTAPDDNAFDGRNVEFHIFLRCGKGGVTSTRYVYTFDDGETNDYKRGKRSRLAVAARAKGRALEIETELLEEGYGHCNAVFVLYDDWSSVALNGAPVRRLTRSSWKFAGTRQQIWRTSALLLSAPSRLGGGTRRFRSAEWSDRAAGAHHAG